MGVAGEPQAVPGRVAPPRCCVARFRDPGSGSELLLWLVQSMVVMIMMAAGAEELEARERLALWDRRSEPLAPLTERQTDSVLELKAATEELPIPAEVRASDRALCCVCAVPIHHMSAVIAASF